MDKQHILKRYSRIGLTLPIILPATLLAIGFSVDKLGMPLTALPGWLLETSVILIGSLFIGGIPYILFFIIAWRFTKTHLGKPTYVFLILSPAIFYIVLLLSLILFQVGQWVWHGYETWPNLDVTNFSLISLMVFPVAYGYIALILIAYHIRLVFFHPQHRGGQHG